MGRVKSMIIKRTAKELIGKVPDVFNKEFNTNKKSLGRTMPSKRMRNKIAGYVTRINQNAKKLIKEEPQNE